MATSRFFEWFPFGVLVGWALIALTRAVLLGRAGVSVVAIDRERTLREMVADACLLACLLAWVYEIIAHVWRLGWHLGPPALHVAVVRGEGIRLVGGMMGLASVVLYAFALIDLGPSWRLGIDRKRPGALVTHGIYGWMRHPVYVAFDLAFAGAFLALGQPIFLVLALLWIPLIHGMMLREERFLLARHGDAYLEYGRRVGRYMTWRRGRSGI